MKRETLVLCGVTAFLLLASDIIYAEEQLLSCAGVKTMHSSVSETKLDGEVTLIVDGTRLTTDFGDSVELSEKDNFTHRWIKEAPGTLQRWELNTISGLLMHSISQSIDEGGYELSHIHVYYCKRVEKRIIE